MRSAPSNVGIFYGQVDKRAKGWYWADTGSEKPRGSIRGPFETKESRVGNAMRSLGGDSRAEPLRGAVTPRMILLETRPMPTTTEVSRTVPRANGGLAASARFQPAPPAAHCWRAS
jgi:hypothetical protein